MACFTGVIGGCLHLAEVVVALYVCLKGLTGMAGGAGIGVAEAWILISVPYGAAD